MGRRPRRRRYTPYEPEASLHLFNKKDRIHSFDIRYSLFDIRFFSVSFSIKLAAFQASGWADT
jgi:hypothetical protein